MVALPVGLPEVVVPFPSPPSQVSPRQYAAPAVVAAFGDLLEGYSLA